MPAFKVEETLRKAIESVRKQTYADFELIIVDDFSPDKSGEIAEEVSKVDKRIKVIRNKNNKGLAESRNIGLLQSRGEVVGFLDSDDYLPENTLKEVHKHLENGVDAVIFSYFRIEQGNTFPVILPRCSGSEVKELLCADEIQSFSWNKYIRRNKVPIDLFPKGKKFEDFFAFPELFWKFKEIRVLQKPLYYYNCVNDNSITKNMDSLSYFDLWSAFKKNEEILEIKGKNHRLLILTRDKTFFSLSRCLCLDSVDGRLNDEQRKEIRSYLMKSLLRRSIKGKKRKALTILALLKLNKLIRFYVIKRGLDQKFKKY